MIPDSEIIAASNPYFAERKIKEISVIIFVFCLLGPKIFTPSLYNLLNKKFNKSVDHINWYYLFKFRILLETKYKNYSYFVFSSFLIIFILYK